MAGGRDDTSGLIGGRGGCSTLCTSVRLKLDYVGCMLLAVAWTVGVLSFEHVWFDFVRLEAV